MDRSNATAIVGSIVVHAGAAGLIAWTLMFGKPPAPLPISNAVPVQVVSEVEVLGAQPLNPSEELITEDVATAPVETTSEPTPPPTPTPPPPTPSPRPTPPRPTPPRAQPQPTPPRTQPTPPRTQPRPQAPQPQPGFDPDANAGRLNPSPNTNRRRPATGGGATGNAPRTLGRASLQALGAQVRPTFSCTLQGVQDLEIRVQVRLSESGRVVGRPQLLPPRGGPSYQPVSDAVVRAIYAAQPFTMPSDYEEQDISFRFPASQYC